MEERLAKKLIGDEPMDLDAIRAAVIARLKITEQEQKNRFWTSQNDEDTIL